MKLVGILLIIVGIAALAYQGFTYVTHEKIVDIGPLEVSQEHKKTVYVPPVIGGLALIGGIALLLTNSRSARA